ncbi:GBS Bsp-like repeat-containing protein, partial [Enterococcus sp. 5H]|uniref:GBS Bsp-like repeat-containing protein n=1 Tax=Enterococcus sp. 5H TaxID=1229490 RepID=UPI002304BB2D
MKKSNKLITLGILTTMLCYTFSPVMTLADQEHSDTAESIEQAAGFSSDSDLESMNPFPLGEIQSSTSREIESSSSEEPMTNTAEVETNKSTVDVSAFENKEIVLVPAANADIRFSESDNGSVHVSDKTTLRDQKYIFNLSEDGWWTIQNSTTKNYLTVANEGTGSVYFTTLQNSDEQQWRLVDEENGTYHIESRTNQFLEITETNELQTGNGDLKQRWAIELPEQDTQSTESNGSESSTESTTETTTQETKEIQEPKAISNTFNEVEKTPIGNTKIRITISNLSVSNASKVEFPTWSNTNGQDDIKWLNGTKNSDGSYSVIVDANEYKHDGQFITHIYATTNGTRSGIGSTSYNLEFPPMNVVEKTAIGKDKMKVTIYNPNRGNMSKVEFPTWSNTNGQDDIKWLNGTKNSDGSYSVIVDANEYKHDGQFITHIYATTNGTRSGIGSTSYNLEFPPMNVVEKTAIGKDKMKVTIYNPNRGNVSKVEFPTWSNTNGQDDIKWLNGTKNSDGSYSVIVDANEYKHDGQFITHIYATTNGTRSGIGSTSYNLEFPPMNVVEKTAIGKDKMKVTIYNPNRGNVSKVEFPTWSNTNGQDDIKWLNGTKNSDGSYSV